VRNPPRGPGGNWGFLGDFHSGGYREERVISLGLVSAKEGSRFPPTRAGASEGEPLNRVSRGGWGRNCERGLKIVCKFGKGHASWKRTKFGGCATGKSQGFGDREAGKRTSLLIKKGCPEKIYRSVCPVKNEDRCPPERKTTIPLKPTKKPKKPGHQIKGLVYSEEISG